MQVAVGYGATAESKHDLPGGRRVTDARSAELGDATHRLRALNEVDGDRVALAGDRERRRLARHVDERLQMRTRKIAEVEPPERRVAELDKPEPQPVATRIGDALDESAGNERRELPGRGARVQTGAPRDLVRPELAVGQRLEHGNGPLDGCDVTYGWLSGARHATFGLILERYCRRDNT